MAYVAENCKLAKVLNDPRLLVKNFCRDRAKLIKPGLMSLTLQPPYSKFHLIRRLVVTDYIII